MVGAVVVGAVALPNEEELVQAVPPPPGEQLVRVIVVMQHEVAVPQLELVFHEGK